MAKAIFEGDPYKSVNTSTFHVDNPRPEGNWDPNRKQTGKKEVAENPLHLSGHRELFMEDLSRAAQHRMELKHAEFQARLSGEVTKSSAKPGPSQFQAAKSMKTRGETSSEAAYRIATDMTAWAHHPGVFREEDTSHTMPGAGWYFRHNAHYRTTHPDVPEASDIGSVMSPLNSPDNEKAATRGLLSVKDKYITIDDGLADHIRKKVGTEALPEHHVGVPVQTKHLHPDVISVLTRASTEETHAGALDKWSTPEDRMDIRKAGTNVDSGVRVAYKGEPLESVAGPQSAPKVYNYGLANRNFHPTKAGAQYYMSRVAQAEEPKPGMIPMNDSQQFKMTSGLVRHVLNHLGHGTDSFDPQDRAVQEVVQSEGKIMHMDFAHPAIVQALADHGVRRSHPRVHAQALASMNHPIVGDSWMNAVVSGQPQASVLPTDEEGNLTGERPPGNSSASVHKEAGIYWPNMSIHNPERTKDGGQEHILDASDKNVYDSGRGLHHVFTDHVVRRSARLRNVPSVAAQESDWTVTRRVAGRDGAMTLSFSRNGEFSSGTAR